MEGLYRLYTGRNIDLNAGILHPRKADVT